MSIYLALFENTGLRARLELQLQPLKSPEQWLTHLSGIESFTQTERTTYGQKNGTDRIKDEMTDARKDEMN